MRKFKLGQKAQRKKSFSYDEVKAYTKGSVDCNPIHYDEEYAQNTIFKGRIVPGLQVASLFGGLLGSDLPGKGTIHLGQNLKFLKPVYIGEDVCALIEITNIRVDKPIITFKTTCLKSNNEVAIEGTAVVKVLEE